MDIFHLEGPQGQLLGLVLLQRVTAALWPLDFRKSKQEFTALWLLSFS